jgi:hypothetical protein
MLAANAARISDAQATKFDCAVLAQTSLFPEELKAAQCAARIHQAKCIQELLLQLIFSKP